MFIRHYGGALRDAGFARRPTSDPSSPDNVEDLRQARLMLYTAEHYLQDAFSAGHQVAATDIQKAVDDLLGSADIAWMTPIIASEVFAQKKDVIGCYAHLTPLGWDPIDTPAEFVGVATLGGWWLGRDPLYDAMRKFIHEELDHVGVEVASAARPTPWILPGDHSLDPEHAPETVEALQHAIADARARFETTPYLPGMQPFAVAKELFEHHRPRPTGAGRSAVADALARGTASKRAFMDAIVTATASTIEGAMDYLVTMSGGKVVKEMKRPPVEERPWPEIPAYDPDAPRCDDPVSNGGSLPGESPAYGPGGTSTAYGTR
jgi:hypothetical protein